ncbi:MAG TPA: dihydroxy-acid dehydratase, partial [Pseudonocardiaceae bacterium]|nr:dihydroxy-acid dehydratase [Pseudonocardiaceae bacterium]
AVVKSAGFDSDVFEGTARVFDGERGAMDAVGSLNPGDVVVIRYEGPKGGPLALVHDGDQIRLDLRTRTLDLLVDADELAHRRQSWSPSPPRYPTGALGKYARLVGSAARGAVCE